MSIPLTDGCRVGVIGGGPAGSLFSYFLLTFANRLDLDVTLDIYEPRDFTKPGPGGCNMCGGIVSELLVQMLAAEGINLPPAIVQRGIDSYVLHTDETSTRIDTPLKEKRIAAIHRGGGPRDVKELRWGGLDGYLLGLAREMGATVIPARVSDAGWDGERPRVQAGEESATYDLLVGATGVNSSGWDLFENLGFRSRRPRTTKTLHHGTEPGPRADQRQFRQRDACLPPEHPAPGLRRHHPQGRLRDGLPPWAGHRQGLDSGVLR
jgi:flavin-dependent dehydrogenase